MERKENEMIAQTPPMGWNSWNTIGKEIDEDIIKQTADALCSHGLKERGYEYVVVDDCRQAGQWPLACSILVKWAGNVFQSSGKHFV